MTWALSAMVIPAVRYNKKSSQTLGAFFIFSAIRARKDL
jgi:hypothetical protein